ncbi:uncharacterized protein LOC113360132 [Papaver somniferum]|uniref:uncharacterized protein LOC113360132 n=1 Tax=Papaver somniferum TaxID=3469 RepID=UPI000E6FF231|nr:uncharacterized protein LOC113360132 [Papaver somniferum]
MHTHYFRADRGQALADARKQLKNWQDIEEKFWKTKSRDQLIKMGDQNTSYFHRATKSRARRNKIEFIQNEEGNWITEYQEVKDCFTNHFSQMATAETTSPSSEIINLIPLAITPEDNTILNRKTEPEEIKAILFSMSNDKAPGPDGFPPNFFKLNWDIIGNDIVSMVQHFFLFGHLLKEMNATFIALIPKVDNPTSPSHFRPIRLCNTTYKIISKLLAQRMKPFLTKIISPYQSAFIPGRQISDNIAIAHEIIIPSGLKEEKKATLDSSACWGDGIINGIKICKAAPPISHLLFADDCMIFCKANTIEAQNIMQLLQLFGSTSGQLINFHKSGVFFSKNTHPDLIPQISNSTGVQVLHLDDKYLGSPLFIHRSKINSFKPGVEKLKLRLTGWKHTPLNPAGREDKDSLWYKLMDAKYLLGRNVLSMNTKSKDGDSWIWKGILEGKSNIHQHCSWRIGNGRKIKIWEDIWIQNTNSRLQKPQNCPQYIDKLEALILPDGNWDEDQVSTYFSMEEAVVIITL